MLKIRQMHLYLGTFFAPSIIFFALTGAFQTFSLHEEHMGKPGIPIIEWMGEIHKNQRLTTLKTPAPETQAAPKPAAEAAQAAAPRPRPAGPARRAKSVPLKIFVGFMAVGLIVSTCLGIYMSFRSTRQKGKVWAMLALGTALPIVLLYF